VIYDALRVLDLTAGIAGAYCAKLLTDLGADVVYRDAPDDPLWTYLRTSQQRAGRDVGRWIAAADVVLVGEPGHVDPAPLVTVSITPLGHGGPDDGLFLTEEVLQARSGSLSNHGFMDRAPLTVGGNLGEYVTGAFAALGAATAWHRASRTGVAEHVDVSMLEAMQQTFVTAPTVMSRFPGGFMGSYRWVMIPGNEPTGDERFVGITTVTSQQWLSLCRLMGRDDLCASPTHQSTECWWSRAA
jgi:crotonobetainyl-CoA:carnitine CoA-transferase CaiB-like acyl-CoA transferase